MFAIQFRCIHRLTGSERASVPREATLKRFQMPHLRALAIALAIGVIGACSLQAQAQLKAVKHGKAGPWTIHAIYNGKAFNHCRAGGTYKSGTKVYLVAYANGNWTIQFSRSDWPHRKVSRFPATVFVDGRRMMRTQARYRGRSAFIDLGASSQRVQAIMRGRVMSVKSQSGTSSFKLTGTFRAAEAIGRCWRRHRSNTVAQKDGAFATRPGGAFAAPATPAPGTSGAFGAQPSGRKSRIAPRSVTLEYATRYLSRAKQRYKILPAKKNVFKRFPVNWRYANGRMGGMMIATSTRLTAEKGLDALLSSQAKWCKGRSAIDRQPTKGRSGRRIARARGICEARGRITSHDYSVAELGNRRVVVIMEASVQRAESAPARPLPDRSPDRLPAPPGDLQPPGSNELPRTLPGAPSPGSQFGTPPRRLGPNDL